MEVLNTEKCWFLKCVNPIYPMLCNFPTLQDFTNENWYTRILHGGQDDLTNNAEVTDNKNSNVTVGTAWV